MLNLSDISSVARSAIVVISKNNYTEQTMLNKVSNIDE